MLTLDRSILKQFLINFVILTTVIMTLFVTVDIVVDMDEFLKAGQYHALKQRVDQIAPDYGLSPEQLLDAMDGGAKNKRLARVTGLSVEEAKAVTKACESTRWELLGATVYKLVDFYGPLLLVIYVYLSGILVVGAMGFTLTSMLRNHELIALAASGVSLYRVAAPIVIAGVALNAVTLPIQEYLVPPMAPKLIRSKSQAKYETISTFSQYLIPDGKGALLSAATFEAEKNRLKDVVINVRDDRGVSIKRISADLAEWDESRQGWALKPQGVVLPMASAAQGDGISLREQAVEIQMTNFYETPLSPKVLLARRAESYSGFLSLRQLQTMQSNTAVPENLRENMTRTIWSRFSLMVVNTLLLLMSLPGFLRLTPGNLLLSSVKAAGGSLGAWVGALIGMQFSTLGLNPISTAWMPVVLMLPLSFIALQKIRS